MANKNNVIATLSFGNVSKGMKCPLLDFFVRFLSTQRVIGATLQESFLVPSAASMTDKGLFYNRSSPRSLRPLTFVRR